MCPVSRGTSRSTLALETGEAKLWLVLVGVNEYQDKRLPSLRYSALDCQGLGEALAQATQGFPRKEVRIYHDFTVRQPEGEAIRASLMQIAGMAKPQDTILFYFSGHGMLEPSNQQAVLCLADTDTDRLLDTGLCLQDVLQLLGSCAARQQLVWLDACHSGGMTLLGARGKIEAEPLLNPTPQLVEVLRQRAAESKGFYALLSCDRAQQSWEFPELGHGVFTYYLMRGLRGEAADSQGIIEADGLYRYVYHQTLQYIDKINQQLQLINQQKRARGETQLHSRYPLQTPKRIVEAVGELVLGLRPTPIEPHYPRQALIVEGLASNKTTLALSIVLRGAGNFKLEYWPRAGKSGASDVREAIARQLEPLFLAQEEPATVLLYLHGRIESTEAGDSELVVGDDIRLTRSWLRQQLRRCRNARQIVILDCLEGSGDRVFLQDWVEDLQCDLEQGQCVIAAIAPPEAPEQFTQALLDTLVTVSGPVGLTVAGWIGQLQVHLADSGIQLYFSLSLAQGIVEVIPGSTGARDIEPAEGLDLGLCPYMGLSAFGEEDAQYFYGREALIQQLLNPVAHQSFLAVVGASGSGKSSVIHAGLMRSLRQGKQLPSSEQWWLRSVRPGARPLESLSWRLVDPGTQKEKAYQQQQLEGMLYQGVEGFVYWIRSRPEPMVVLVVDQFEELFTLAPAEDRDRFLALVLGALEYAADRFKLAIGLRADFIAPCLELPTLARLLQQSSVLVPPCLSEDDYRRVIINPAEQVGLKVEPELVEVLLRELYGQGPAGTPKAGDLPLLEFVLEQLWQHRDSGRLTLETYFQKIGGLKGALERKAQAVYDSLDPEAQGCAQWIFLSLTQLGEGTEDTRRRVQKSDLVVAKYTIELVEKTLQTLIAAKLVAISWEEGERAIGQSRGSEQIPVNDSLVKRNHRGTEFAEERIGGDREITGVLEGDSGADAELPEEELLLETMKQEVTVEVTHEILIRHWSTLRWWLEENRARLSVQRQLEQAAQLWQQSDRQSDFLLRGMRLAEAEEIYIKYTDELSEEVQRFIEAGLEERQQQQLQAKRRQKTVQAVAVSMSVLGLAALGFGGVAYWQTQNVQQREIETLNSLSEALFFSDRQLESLAVSVKAGQLLQKTGANDELKVKTATTLQQALYTQESNRLEGHSALVGSVRFSPNGQQIASGSWDGTVRLWKADGTLLRSLKGHTAQVTGVSFSPDGQTIASASLDQTIRLWRIDGTLLKTFTGHTADVTSVSFSPDGQLLASSSSDKTVKLWRVDGKLLKTFTGHTADVTSVSFSPNGQLLASASLDKTVRLWRIDGTPVKTLSVHTGEVVSVSFSPNGQLLASAGLDKSIKLWRTDGTLVNSLDGHEAVVRDVTFSPDSQTLASASDDKTVKLWNLTDGSLLAALKGHGGWVMGVSFSPDGHTLASASGDKTVRLWNLSAHPIWHDSPIYSASFSPDGKILASASFDKTVKLWRISDRTLLKTLDGHGMTVETANFSPDGKLLASASADNTVKLWRVADGVLLKTLKGHSNYVYDVSFSPDGKSIATASEDTTVKLWSVDGTLLKTLTGHQDRVNAVSFSPDGKSIASASFDNTVKLWRVADGTLVKTLTGRDGHQAEVTSVSFSPDGRTLASASWDNTVKLWRVADGTAFKTLTGHQDRVTAVSFSPNGKILASSSADKTVKLWNAEGVLLKTLVGHSAEVTSVGFSPDGKMLASASEDKTVMVWNLELDSLLKRSCDRLHNYLKTNPNVQQRDRDTCARM